MAYNRPATDTPQGFHPYGNPLRARRYRTDGAAAAIYPNDLVGQMADGCVETITSVTASMILGAAAEYVAASGTGGVLVYDDPEQEFIVQDDSDTTGMTALSEGLVIAPILTTGNTTTLRSRQEIDSSSAAAAPTAAVGHSLRVIRLAELESESYATTTAQQRKWIVKVLPYWHQLATTSGI